MLFSLANIVIQSSVNSFGTTIMAGNSASQNIEGFAFTSMNAFHQAAVSFTGQNAGARKYERINKILYTSLGYVLIVGIVFCFIYMTFGKYLIGFYTDSPEVVTAGVNRLVIIAASYAICGLMDVSTGALRGIGESFIPMVISVLGVCGIRIGWIYTIFQIPQFHTPQSLYISYPISWGITFLCQVIAFLIVYRKQK